MNNLIQDENTHDKRVITLKEIVDMINVDRVAKGENKLEHSKQMLKVDELCKESSFGGVDKIATPTFNPDGTANKTIETYSLTKIQAIAVGAKLDNTRLMMIVMKLEEPAKALTFEEMAKQTILLADKKIKELEKEKELALIGKKKAEDNVLVLTHTNKLYTATEIAKEIGFKSSIAFNKQLKENKIQYKQNKTWVLYSEYADSGFTSIKQHVLDSGTIIYDRKWTGIGRDFLLDFFKDYSKK